MSISKIIVGALVIGYLAIAATVWHTNNVREAREEQLITKAAIAAVERQREVKPESQVHPLFDNWFGRKEEPQKAVPDVPPVVEQPSVTETPVVETVPDIGPSAPEPKADRPPPVRRVAEKTKKVVNRAIDGVADVVQGTIDTLKSVKCSGDQEWKSNRDCKWVRETWGGTSIGPYDRVGDQVIYDRR